MKFNRLMDTPCFGNYYDSDCDIATGWKIKGWVDEFYGCNAKITLYPVGTCGRWCAGRVGKDVSIEAGDVLNEEEPYLIYGPIEWYEV